MFTERDEVGALGNPSIADVSRDAAERLGEPVAQQGFARPPRGSRQPHADDGERQHGPEQHNQKQPRAKRKGLG